ncbi:MAG: hypothetical protein JXR53_08755 [Bacteroidales bacterium]|nr:hypothetical protein [Bacteroidales bacterium]
MRKIASRVFTLVLLLVFSSGTAFAIEFDDLLISGKINAYATGNDESVHYAIPLKIIIRNNTSSTIQIRIPAGYTFHPDDSSYQNIIVTNTILLALAPGRSAPIEVYGMCMESSDHAPEGEARYTSAGMAEPKIVKLAEYIEENKYFNPAGQNAMWTLIEDRPLYEVTSLDTSAAYKLQHFLADLTGKPILPAPEEEAYLYNYEERPSNVSVGGEVEIHTSSVMQVQWCLFSEDGILLREMYNGPLGPGDVTLEFEYDAQVYDAPVYYLKLVADGEIIYNRRLAFDND